MNNSCIVITDSEDDGTLPSISSCSEKEVSDDDLPAKLHGAGNPKISSLAGLTPFTPTLGRPRRPRKRFAPLNERSNYEKKGFVGLLCESSSSSGDDEDVDLQKAIAESVQDSFPEMCSKGSCIKRKRNASGQDSKAKTWSQKRAEHLASQDISLSSESPIIVSSESSGVEEDPDMDDFLPDLQPEPTCSMVQSDFHPKTTSSRSLRKLKKERHFMDLFGSASKHRKVELEEDTNLLAGTDDNQSEDQESLESSTRIEMQMKRQRDRISRELQAGSSPVPRKGYNVFKFPVENVSNGSERIVPKVAVETDTRTRRAKNRFSGVKFLQDLPTVPSTENKVCLDFSRLQASCLDDLSDELGDSCSFSNFIDLLEGFSSKRKPPTVLIDKVVNYGFFTPVDEKVSLRSFALVLKIWQMYPDLTNIDALSVNQNLVLVAGDVLQKHLQNTLSPAGTMNMISVANSRVSGLKSMPSIHQAKLFFQLFVKGLQFNLSECTLADQKSVCKSLAYACLSCDNSSQTLTKKVTDWLDFCLMVRQPEHMAEAKQWLCQLQTLLSVNILVSRDRQEAAKMLAHKLKRTYRYLPDLSVKKEFLQSFTCPLLCFYVLRLVMEDQCESTIISSQFPPAIHDVIHNYYVALPPQDHMTPPPSPSDDEDVMAHGHSQAYSAESCEELAMLIYFISKSYIACKQRRCSGDLRLQILKGSDVPVLTLDQRQEFRDSVQEFGAHLRSLSPELSAATMTYLRLLNCLCSCN